MYDDRVVKATRSEPMNHELAPLGGVPIGLVDSWRSVGWRGRPRVLSPLSRC
jgi:hypothetical protein